VESLSEGCGAGFSKAEATPEDDLPLFLLVGPQGLEPWTKGL